jgi:hypothetical protein
VKSKRAYAYAILSPRTHDVIYVGVCENPGQRMFGHRHCLVLDRWQRSYPLRILGSSMWSRRFVMEKRWIEFYRSRGIPLSAHGVSQRYRQAKRRMNRYFLQELNLWKSRAT